MSKRASTVRAGAPAMRVPAAVHLRVLWPPFGPLWTLIEWRRAPPGPARDALQRPALTQGLALLVLFLHGAIHAGVVFMRSLADSVAHAAWIDTTLAACLYLNLGSGVLEYGALVVGAVLITRDTP